jgi:hypothetical protein
MDGWWTVTAGCTVVVCLDPTAVLMDRSPDPPAATATADRLMVDHLIRLRQQSRREREAEGLGGLQVDDELESRSWCSRR